MATPKGKPATDMIAPATVAFHGLGDVAGEESRQILFDSTIFRQCPSLDAVVVVRNGHVPWIPHDMDDALVSGIEAFMALQDSRTRNP